MAENKTQTQAVNSVPKASEAPTHTCEYVDCVYHAEGATMNKATGHLTKFRVHFKSDAALKKHALESFTRVVAQGKRGDKALRPNPDGSPVDVYNDMTLVNTVDDYIERVRKMSPEERAAEEKRVKAFLALSNGA